MSDESTHNLEIAAEIATRGGRIRLLPADWPNAQFDTSHQTATRWPVATAEQILSAEPNVFISCETGILFDVLEVDYSYDGDIALMDVESGLNNPAGQIEDWHGRTQYLIPATDLGSFDAGDRLYLGAGASVSIPGRGDDAVGDERFVWAIEPDWAVLTKAGDASLREALVSGEGFGGYPAGDSTIPWNGKQWREDHREISDERLRALVHYVWTSDDADPDIRLHLAAIRAGRLLNNPAHPQRVAVVTALVDAAIESGIVAQWGLPHCIHFIRGGLNCGFGGYFHQADIEGHPAANLAIEPFGTPRFLNPRDQHEA